MPTGDKLVKGNEVRVGGFRVGVVDEITPKVVEDDGEAKAVAVIAHEARQDRRAAGHRHQHHGPAALGARPQVRRDHARQGGSRPTPPATRSRWSNASERARARGRVLDLRPADARGNSQAALEGFGDAFAGRGQSLNTAIQALNPLFRHLTPVMTHARRPGHRARPVLPPARPRRGAGRAGRRGAGRAVHQHGRHLRGDQRDPARAAGDDREVAAHDRRGDQLLPRAAALPGRLRRPVAPPAPGGARAAALAAGDQPRLPGGHAGPAAHRRAQRAPRRASSTSSTTCSRTPTRCSRCATCAPRSRSRGRRLEFVAPYQTVCNYGNYFLHPLGRAPVELRRPRRHRPEPGRRSSPNTEQPNTLRQRSRRSRPWTLPTGQRRPAGPGPDRPRAPRAGAALPAGDRRAGQRRLPERPGRLSRAARWPQAPATGRARCPTARRPAATRRSPIDNYPILSGGTYKSRELGHRQPAGRGQAGDEAQAQASAAPAACRRSRRA